MTFVGRTGWEVTCELLAQWAIAEIPPPHADDVPVYDEWIVRRDHVAAELARFPARERIAESESLALIDAAGAGPVGAHAAAWALDQARWVTFSASWARGREVVPQPGDLFPVTDWDLALRPLNRRLSRPWQTQMRNDELPHVRRYRQDAGVPAVVFDGHLYDELSFLSAVRFVSAAVLNESLDEFSIPENAFPVRPNDVDAQTSAVVRVTEHEVSGPASLVAFAELSVPEEAIELLRTVVEQASGNVVVVAGSCHIDRGGQRQNVSSLLTVAGDIVTFVKRAPLWDADIREGIDQVNEPMRVLVAGDVRLAVVICKDFLTETTQTALAHAGVNLLVVPSMSGVTDLHDISARTMAMRSHALSFVVNGPRQWGERQPCVAMVGRPEAGVDDVVRVSLGVAPIGVVRCDLRSGEFTLLEIPAD